MDAMLKDNKKDWKVKTSGPKIRCKHCGDIIQSMHRHDFVVCGCFSNTEDNTGVAIDGGCYYTRIIGNLDGYELVEDDVQNTSDGV